MYILDEFLQTSMPVFFCQPKNSAVILVPWSVGPLYIYMVRSVKDFPLLSIEFGGIPIWQANSQTGRPIYIQT